MAPVICRILLTHCQRLWHFAYSPRRSSARMFTNSLTTPPWPRSNSPNVTSPNFHMVGTTSSKTQRSTHFRAAGRPSFSIVYLRYLRFNFATLSGDRIRKLWKNFPDALSVSTNRGFYGGDSLFTPLGVMVALNQTVLPRMSKYTICGIPDFVDTIGWDLGQARLSIN